MKIFHQVLLSLIIQNRSSEKEKQYSHDIITSNPSIYTMDHPDLITLVNVYVDLVVFTRIAGTSKTVSGRYWC